MKKTLLLVFIHGFKGGDDTFGGFPAHLRALVSHALPDVNVVFTTYPKFETRGDLNDCVSKFREWLQNKVIDIEVANETPSPTVDPSVHVVLIGHSMGGIVGAETLRLLASEQLIPPPPDLSSSRSSVDDGKSPVEPNTFMFPHIQGLLAFDTPFLGIAPGVVSYTAENHYRNATTAYGALSEVAGVFGWGSKDPTRPENSTGNGGTKAPALPPVESSSSAAVDAAATPSWQRWGRYAMYAGAAGAVAAGGAAALYSQREKFLAGWSWATSHLEFVGCLGRPEELRRRLATIKDLQRGREIGCADFYTCLGQGAVKITSTSDVKDASSSFSRAILRSKIRTFCNLPEDVDEQEDDNTKASNSSGGIKWIKAVNDKATDETKAHISMFSPKDNPSYHNLSHQACALLVSWVDKGWYSTSSADYGRGPGEGQRHSAESNGDQASKVPVDGKGFMDADDVVVVD